MKPISDYMIKDIVSIDQNRSIAEAVATMREKRIGAIMVQDESDRTVGIFTERDLLTRVDLKGEENKTEAPVREFMTRDLITADHQEQYSPVLKMMKAKNLRHLPITENGNVVGMVSLRDMMSRYEENLEVLLEEKEAQLLENIAKIKESEERFRTIFNNSAVAIAFADNNERIIAWNPLTTELLGLGDEELYNRPVEELYPDEEWERIRSYNMRKFGMKHHLEVRMKHKDGHLIDVDLSISVLKDSEGEVIGSIGIMRDIRDRKQAEEKLLKSRTQLELANRDLAANSVKLQEMVTSREETNRKLRETQRQIIQIEKMATIGTLAAGFAHEIKNPLAIILQGIERFERIFEKEQQPERAQYLRIVKDAAIRANDVVTSILQYSRSARMELQPVNIYDVLDSATELINSNARDLNVKINKDYQRVSQLISGDGVMLQQVFFDLMTNAIDAMPQGGTIDIQASYRHPENDGESETGDFVVTVRDTGTGMTQQQIAKIFDPFYTTKEVGKGTGLGLSTVFLIVEKHQGSIQVDSHPDRGTTFTIILPAA